MQKKKHICHHILHLKTCCTLIKIDSQLEGVPFQLYITRNSNKKTLLPSCDYSEGFLLKYSMFVYMYSFKIEQFDCLA